MGLAQSFLPTASTHLKAPKRLFPQSGSGLYHRSNCTLCLIEPGHRFVRKRNVCVLVTVCVGWDLRKVKSTREIRKELLGKASNFEVERRLIQSSWLSGQHKRSLNLCQSWSGPAEYLSLWHNLLCNGWLALWLMLENTSLQYELNRTPPNQIKLPLKTQRTWRCVAHHFFSPIKHPVSPTSS